MDKMIDEMFDAYIKAIKQENEEDGKKVEGLIEGMLSMMSEEKQLQCKKETLVRLLQEL